MTVKTYNKKVYYVFFHIYTELPSSMDFPFCGQININECHKKRFTTMHKLQIIGDQFLGVTFR